MACLLSSRSYRSRLQSRQCDPRSSATTNMSKPSKVPLPQARSSPRLIPFLNHKASNTCKSHVRNSIGHLCWQPYLLLTSNLYSAFSLAEKARIDGLSGPLWVRQKLSQWMAIYTRIKIFRDTKHSLQPTIRILTSHLIYCTSKSRRPTSYEKQLQVREVQGKGSSLALWQLQ